MTNQEMAIKVVLAIITRSGIDIDSILSVKAKDEETYNFYKVVIKHIDSYESAFNNPAVSTIKARVCFVGSTVMIDIYRTDGDQVMLAYKLIEDRMESLLSNDVIEL